MTSPLIEKLKSRKLWVGIASGVVIVFGKAFGLNLTDAQLWSLATTAAGYLLGQSAVDAITRYKP